MAEEIAYDNFGAIASRSYTYAGSPIYSEIYTRDKLQRITVKTISDGSISRNYSYSYNTAGRLSEVKLGQSIKSQYLYDDQGNRTQGLIDGVGSLGTYDAQDRLVTYGDYQYFFNDDGELSSKLNTTNSQTSSYVYTTLGQLSSVNLPDGRVISYQIDGENKRMSRSIDGVLQSYYAYDMGGRLVAELDSSGSLKSRFVYATQSHSPDYMVTAGGTFGFIKDQLGSIKMVVNSNTGAIAQNIEYDEFGRVLNDSSPMFQPFGFAGGIYDSETKLVRFGARDYDAETGRWTARDPILFSGTDLNLYSYVHGNPINRIDPSGLTDKDVELALQWLKKSDPTLFENLNPKFIDGGSLGKTSDGDDIFGETITKDLIKLDYGKLDTVGAEGCSSRVREYVRAVSHELQHASDLQKWNIYNILLFNYNGRHEQIMERSANDAINYDMGK